MAEDPGGPKPSSPMPSSPARAFALAAYDDPAALARALAAHVAQALLARIGREGQASLAVSGGRTPTRFFETLSTAPLDWSRITVTLVDERWAPETSERSNAALVRAHLLKGPAAQARFVPLFTGAPTPEDGLAEAEAAACGVPRPFAAVVLGMGDDGHTASFFPHADGLASALAPEAGQRLAAIRAAAAGEPRITYTLPALLTADTLLLHIEGMAKRAVLETAAAAGPVADMPIRAVLDQAPRPLDVLWCP